MKLRRSVEKLKGTIRVPGDKSISHRSIILVPLQKVLPVSTIFYVGKMSCQPCRSFVIWV